MFVRKLERLRKNEMKIKRIGKNVPLKMTERNEERTKNITFSMNFQYSQLRMRMNTKLSTKRK